MDEEDEFLASIGASIEVGEAEFLSGIGASAEPPTELPGAPALPAGHRETGEVNRVTQLPGMTFSPGQTTMADGPAEVYEERITEKAPSGHDVVMGTQVGPDSRERSFPMEGRDGGSLSFARQQWGRDQIDRMAEGVGHATGREAPSPGSLSRAVRGWQEGEYRNIPTGLEPTPTLERLSSLLDTALPTGRTAEPIEGSDSRTIAPALGFAQAGTLGFADELAASVPGAGTYAERRDRMRQYDTHAEEQNPTGSAIGAAGGLGVTLLAAGGLGAVEQGAGAMARMAGAARAGGVLGGIRGAGESEETTGGGVLADAATGGAGEALLGGAFSGGASLLGRGATRLASAAGVIDDAAAEARMVASGLQPHPSPRTPYGRSIRTAGGSRGVAQRLDAEAFGGSWPTPQATREALPRMEQEVGNVFDDVLQQMDDVGGGVNRAEYATRLEALARELEATPIASYQSAARRVRSEFIVPLRLGQSTIPATPLSWSEAHHLRTSLGRVGKVFDRASDPAEQSLAGITASARQELSSLMDASVGSVGPELQAAWRSANRRWQLLRLVDDNAREHGSRLTGAIAEGAHLAEGNVIGAIGSRTAGSLMSRFGPGARARVLQRLAPMIRNAGPSGARFAQILDTAEQTGMGRAAAHYLLMRTRPEYRSMLESDETDRSEETTHE